VSAAWVLLSPSEWGAVAAAACMCLCVTPVCLMRAENPVADRPTGIAQGALRVSYRSLNKKAALARAYACMARQYPNSTFYVTVTCNVVLRHNRDHTFQVFYGQSFGRARTVYLKSNKNDDLLQQQQQHQPLESLFLEYPVASATQASELPTDWSLADFQELYRQHFDNSNVEVHEVISLVYFFSKGLENYARDHTLSTRPQVVALFP
jgi:hypothetical protein